MKFRDDRGEWLDIEATSGIVVNDAFYRRKLSISPAALKNGIYLCPLAPKEAVAALLEPLMASYGRRDPQKIIEVAGMALGANSKDTSAMIYIADGYYDLFKQRYVDRYPDPKNIPQAEAQAATWMSRQNSYWVNRAESLGWEPETAADKTIYFKASRVKKPAGRARNDTEQGFDCTSAGACRYHRFRTVPLCRSSCCRHDDGGQPQSVLVCQRQPLQEHRFGRPRLHHRRQTGQLQRDGDGQSYTSEVLISGAHGLSGSHQFERKQLSPLRHRDVSRTRFGSPC